MDALALFHPVVRCWFERRFPLGPTEPQERGWPAIASGRDTLIAAPTGSGKTLAAFLVCIDRLLREAERGALPDATDVVYVSPLKALASDVRENLIAPLSEIAATARERGAMLPEIRAEVRSGDTPASRRASLVKRPPHILVTTPESLYLMLTAERSRATLRGVRTVIVDEIHATARDKRGSHLALSLERLEALCERRPARIGLSATQRPIERIARLLVGASADATLPDGGARCEIVDAGHRRALDLAVWVPGSELSAVASMEQWGEVVAEIARQVQAHRTTLVFSNTRRQAERIAHLLGEKLGADRVAAHHGSLAVDRRQRIERRLRDGELAALVATASLELGIDIGPVELVCQLGSPRGLSTFLQRVGRSGHARGAVPKGRLFPTTRDELVECAAVVRGVRAGELDAIHPPVAPLDILAQQIVAACAAEPWKEADLFDLVRRAAPYAELAHSDFDEVVALVSEGIETGRGRRAAYVHRDRVNSVLRGRRGARIAALTSGGAIPETADYRVVADPDDTVVGTVNEDWAIESMAGDVFLLGSTSWQIRRVEAGVVRVRDAHGAPPTVPFWLGEAPARSAELSREVSALREEVSRHLVAGGAAVARAALAARAGLDAAGAAQVVAYLDASHTALGALPTHRRIVVERFFDESGGMQLVAHAPFGGRINRALGLVARKRICRAFDFELQAAASDDAIVLSLGPQHSFPLEMTRSLLRSDGLREALAQAVLASPMFAARWRWNLGRALAVLRFRGGRKNPPPIQRMEADDLMAAIFPGLAQCQENQAGPIELPDHPLVRQTMHDCLHEALDVGGAVELARAIERGEVELHLRDTSEPSPLAHEILNSKPYTFLDDAPLEERRTRAVSLRRGLPAAARDLARLDAAAVARVREEAALAPRDAEELHDALLSLVILKPVPEWQAWFRELAAAGRVSEVGGFWVATEQRETARALLERDEDAAIAEALRGHLAVVGPATASELAARTGLSETQIERGIAALEVAGYALRGSFDPARSEPEVCARHLLARIHAYTQRRLRSEIEPVSARDFMRFLLRWQCVAPGTRREGRAGTLAAIRQLQGLELASGAWESSVLPARVAEYRAAWLDDLCWSGDVVWGRLGIRGGRVSSRAAPIALAQRADLPWLLAALRGGSVPEMPESEAARAVLGALERGGALFQSEIATRAGVDETAVEPALWELVAGGHITSDGIAALRGLFDGRAAGSARRAARARRRPGRAVQGRWAILSAPPPGDPDAHAELVAQQLLTRWGVVFYDILARENLALSWRELLIALRRLEARGVVRGGRFVTGFTGEQYAWPGAVDALRAVRRMPRAGERVVLSAADPLNLVGILTPGARLPAGGSGSVTWCDGEPESTVAPDAARA
ncbi:MAG TPA: DEAD/DEAH box helicase [Myxococcota bacterium]|nr:DEAD/DEAH box helicase [Myxococcota bacterium]